MPISFSHHKFHFPKHIYKEILVDQKIFSTNPPDLGEKIFSIAYDVRIWAEEYATKHNFSKTLIGMCGKASAELYRRYKESNIECVLHSNKNHFFVVVQNNWLVDVTATQFDFQSYKVIIIKWPVEPKYDHIWWTSTRTHPDDKSVLYYQMTNSWTPEELIDLK